MHMQNHPPGQILQQARQHHQAGRLREAEALYRSILDTTPDHPDANNMLGLLFIQMDRPDAAVDCIRKSLATKPGNAQSHHWLGMALRKLGKSTEAVESYEHALQIAPRNPGAHMNLAVILEETGELDRAADHFRQAIEIKPDLALAHFHLAHMRNHPSSAGEIEAMQALYERPDTGSNQRIHLAYGLGSALDKQGAYEEAFEYFQAGHRLKEASKPFDPDRHTQFVRSLMEVFDQGVQSHGAISVPGDDLPIFIFGMPRSGTSLAEQILASHPGVSGGGELGYVEDTARDIISMTGRPFLDSWNGLDSNELAKLGSKYLARLKSHADGCSRVTDTTPMNFLYVGLIAGILPNARLVHCVRDPMDTCLSIFQQPLSESHAYAHNLSDLGGFYKLYRDLMAHWHRVLPGRIYDLRYEDLVTDSKTGIRRLLAACNLPFHEDCLAFHRTERSVKTPSATQVRQPMYTASIGRWKRYGSKLSPLQAILE